MAISATEEMVRSKRRATSRWCRCRGLQGSAQALAQSSCTAWSTSYADIRRRTRTGQADERTTTNSHAADHVMQACFARMLRTSSGLYHSLPWPALKGITNGLLNAHSSCVRVAPPQYPSWSKSKEMTLFHHTYENSFTHNYPVQSTFTAFISSMSTSLPLIQIIRY